MDSPEYGLAAMGAEEPFAEYGGNAEAAWADKDYLGGVVMRRSTPRARWSPVMDRPRTEKANV